MSNAFASLVGAIKALLEVGPAVSGQIFRARLKPIASQFVDAVVIRIASAVDTELFMGPDQPTDWDTTVQIDCYARTATLDADAGVDELLGKVGARLKSDPTLGGLVGDLRITNLDYDFAAAADQMACVTLTLKVMHRTTNLSLE